MKKLVSLVIILGSVVSLLAQIPSTLPFAFQLGNHAGEPLSLSSVDVKLSILTKREGILLYSEAHTAFTDARGTAALSLGAGSVLFGSMDDIDWHGKSTKLRVEYKKPGDSFWQYVSEQILSPVPYAIVARKSAGQRWGQHDKMLFHLHGKVGIGSTSAPYGIEFGEGLKMLLSNSRSGVPQSSCIIFNAPTDTSKPALLWYNADYKGHVALVAHHYLHYPWRIHQHYSMEVSDDNGEIQTRIEFPWGVDTCVIQNHSSNFTVDGNFTVGDMYRAGRSYLGVNTFVEGTGHFLIAPDTVPGNCGPFELATSESAARLLIASDAGSRSAMLRLQSGLMGFQLLSRNNSFSIRDAEGAVLLQQKKQEGLMAIGGQLPAEKLDVAGNIRVAGEYKYMAGDDGYGEYFETEEFLTEGSPAGINLQTGLVRNFRPGDEFVGITVGRAAFAALHGIENSRRPMQLIIIAGTAQTGGSGLVRKGNRAYTHDEQLVGVYCSPDRILVR